SGPPRSHGGAGRLDDLLTRLERHAPPGGQGNTLSDARLNGASSARRAVEIGGRYGGVTPIARGVGLARCWGQNGAVAPPRAATRDACTSAPLGDGPPMTDRIGP